MNIQKGCLCMDNLGNKFRHEWFQCENKKIFKYLIKKKNKTFVWFVECGFKVGVFYDYTRMD